MHHRPSIIAGAFALLLSWPAHAGGLVIDPFTTFPPTGGGDGYVDIGALMNVAVSDGSEDVQTPANIAVGDFLVAVVTGRYNGITTAASGWTKRAACQYTDWGVETSIFTHPVTSASASPVAVPFSTVSGYPYKGAILQFAGADTFDSVACASGATATHVTPTTTPTTAGGFIVTAVGLYNTAALSFTSTPGTPATTVLSSDSPSSGEHYSLGIAYQPVDSDPDGSATFVTSGARYSASVTLAFH